MKKSISIGVDIGGHHISCAAINIEKNELIKGTLSERSVDNKASAETILSQWADTLKATISKIDLNLLCGIGFAMPGPFDYANGIAMFTAEVNKFGNLYKVNIVQEIRQRLSLSSDISIRFMNDATAFAVAEAWIGKGKDIDRQIALTLGTGFGSAFIHQGIPVLEGEEVPKYGCVWHLPFLDGIADDSFSTRWFENNYLALTGKKVAGVKPIADEARKQETHAISLFETYGKNLGMFLSPWVKTFGAKIIVIGGNVTGAFDLFSPQMYAAFEENRVNVSVVISDLKEMAAIIGSARLSDEAFWPQMVDLVPKM